MPSFPLFVDLSSKRVLVVGAGTVAARKIEKLMLFGPTIFVVATSAQDEVRAWAERGRVTLELRAYREADLESADLVIVAADDLALQQALFEECLKRRIPVNSVDSPKWCTFTFPALVVEGEVTFGISTGGKAPGVAAWLRAWLERTLPPGLPEVVKSVNILREAPEVTTLSTFSERARRVKAHAHELLEAWAAKGPGSAAK
jgi:siroheme synthase-like protein